MADNDVIIKFGADLSELQGALDQIQKGVDGVSSKNDGDGNDKNGKGGGAQRKGGEYKGDDNKYDEAHKRFNILRKDVEATNKVVGGGMFDMLHAVTQGGNAISKAEKQIWKNIHTSFLKTLKDQVQELISSKLQMLERDHLFSAIGIQLDKQTAEQKAAVQKTTTTTVIANQQAQTTAVQTETMKRQAAEQGSQGAQTGAVEAGNAARTASEASASVTQSATQSTSVMSHAKSAAAAVYDDVSQIPLVGWILAPVAAATAFAAVAAFSAEGGWERVPYDGALTELHKDEMVLPATVASTVRAASSAVGAYGLPSQSKEWANPAQPPVSITASQASGGQPVTLNYTPSVSAIDTRGARDFLDQHGRYIVDVLSRQQRNFAQVKK